jgi:hypothetical protein
MVFYINEKVFLLVIRTKKNYLKLFKNKNCNPSKASKINKIPVTLRYRVIFFKNKIVLIYSSSLDVVVFSFLQLLAIVIGISVIDRFPPFIPKSNVLVGMEYVWRIGIIGF